MGKSLRKAFWVATLAAFAAAATAATARATITYNDESSFLSAIQPGHYLEDFNSLTAYGFLGSGPIHFGPMIGFSFDAASTPTGLYAVSSVPSPTFNGALSTLSDTAVLRLTFGGLPTAIGGLFFPTNDPGFPTNGTATVMLTDGTIESIVNDYAAFTGFTSDVPIAWLEISTSPGGVYPTVDHVYVAAAAGSVPEPASIAVWILLGCLGAGLGYVKRNKEASPSPSRSA